MRRFRLIAWVLIAALLLDWAPLPEFLPDDVTQAAAQTPNVTVIGPAGTLYYSTASVILSNVASAGTNIFSIVIPGAMFATQAAANTTSTMTAGQPTLGPLNSSIPLHLQISGLLDTAATPGTINVGVNYGVGTTAHRSDQAALNVVALEFVREPKPLGLHVILVSGDSTDIVHMFENMRANHTVERATQNLWLKRVEV